MIDKMDFTMMLLAETRALILNQNWVIIGWEIGGWCRYDIDNSGAIDKKEMVGVMKAIYAMVDGNVAGAVRGGTEEKASKHAEKLFVLIDVDGDGNLTEKEFLRVLVCSSYGETVSTLFQLLTFFPPVMILEIWCEMSDCSVESFNIIADNGQTSNTQTTLFQRKVFLSALSFYFSSHCHVNMHCMH